MKYILDQNILITWRFPFCLVSVQTLFSAQSAVSLFYAFSVFLLFFFATW